MYLGIDLGTSGVTSLLIDDTQTVTGKAHSPLLVQRPQPGWSEQQPQSWIDATAQTFDQLASDHNKEFKAVKAISLSGQMHDATLLDKSGRVLRPCILWNDTRSHAQAQSLDSDANFRDISGNIVFPGFTAPKLQWLAEHESYLFGQVHKVLLPKDYLRYWLSGDYVSECSDASGTSWLNTRERRWSSTLLENSGMSTDQMPDLVEGSEVSGEMRVELKARWSFDKAPLIGGGAGDNAATAIGMGAINANDAFVSLGTSGVLFAANSHYQPSPQSAVHCFCHAVPQRWHQMGVILSASDALNWLSETTGKSVSTLSAPMGNTLRAPDGPIFLPYLSGERTPHNDAEIRASFVNIGRDTDTAALCRATMEGVAFALADNLAALRATGTLPERLFAVGGGTQSEYWLQVLATSLNLPIDMSKDASAGAALGAARLAMLAGGPHNIDTVCTLPTVTHTVEPNPTLTYAFQEQYAKYRALYPAIKQALRAESL